MAVNPEEIAWSEWVKGAKLFKDIPIGTAFRSTIGGRVQVKIGEPQVGRIQMCMLINARPAVVNRQKPWAGKSEYGAHVNVRVVSPDEIPIPCGAD